MAKSDTRKDKRGAWGLELSITKQLISSDLRSEVLIPLSDLAENVDFNPEEEHKHYLQQIVREFPEEPHSEQITASQIYLVGEMPVTGGYIPKDALFPSDELEEVHAEYIGSEETRYAQ